MKRVLISTTILLLLATFSCTHQNVEVTPTVPQQPADSGTDEVDTALCFERDVLPIFIANCAQSGCHDAASRQDGYEFTSYATITSRKFVPGNLDETELFEKISEHEEDKRMPPPPFPRLTDPQTNLIRRWILMGAPNTTGCKSSCDTNNFAFAAGIQPMLNQYCRGCHSSAAPSAGISLDNYAGVQAVALDGRLMGALRRETGFTAMPQGAAKLSNCKIRQVEKWVAAGAANN